MSCSCRRTCTTDSRTLPKPNRWSRFGVTAAAQTLNRRDTFFPPMAEAVHQHRARQLLGYFAARCFAISYRVTLAAIPAFSDSVDALIGIDTTASQVSVTSRDSPLPSLPTTTTTGSFDQVSPG